MLKVKETLNVQPLVIKYLEKDVLVNNSDFQEMTL